MTGRIVMSSYESLRATGTSVVCLSPWGDHSPLTLPCIRFRDLAVHTVIAATGGFAVVASPAMSGVSDFVVSTFGDTILAANDLIIEHGIKFAVPIYSSRLETTHVKVLLITLKFKHTVEDAALGFFRSSVHRDTDLFATVKDYLAVEKGWFSPYLFASSRRPIIPRSMKPDVIFCHGPFLQGDYRVGETLLNESASVISLCKSLTPAVQEAAVVTPTPHYSFSDLKDLKIPSLSNVFSRSRTPSPEPQLTPLRAPPVPRRMVIVVVGIKPHRKLWMTSARPEESVINYILLNGCPALVVPVKTGSPLIAWDALTLQQLWDVELPSADGIPSKSGKFEGIVMVLLEFLDLCVDWSRVEIQGAEDVTEESKKEKVKDAIQLLVAAAVRSKSSKEVKKEVDAERAGVAMWRIP
ncbi:hypothetical protein BT96DRAFT_921053 [Gymnopus androsaceus JB14]|uniref:Uncharacterized protein n=1 Tax=Gymnopus androsaceus JB14 TaxID=1447944 RepID=A0A6A4HK45_9AGAR|nr:hypothetical protein BT96DRAFT_921053 [Gymnopus androsaceus JB14]